MASLQDATNRRHVVTTSVLPAAASDPTRLHPLTPVIISSPWMSERCQNLWGCIVLASSSAEWMAEFTMERGTFLFPRVFSQKAQCRVHLHLTEHFLMCCINMLFLLFKHRPYLIQRIGDLGKDWKLFWGGKNCTLKKIHKKRQKKYNKAGPNWG